MVSDRVCTPTIRPRVFDPAAQKSRRLPWVSFGREGDTTRREYPVGLYGASSQREDRHTGGSLGIAV